MYFGSGPTKKDAKFACGSVAWANIEVIGAHFPVNISLEHLFIQGGLEPSADATALAAASKAEAEAGGADMRPAASEVPVLDPKVGSITTESRGSSTKQLNTKYDTFTNLYSRMDLHSFKKNNVSNVVAIAIPFKCRKIKNKSN